MYLPLTQPQPAPFDGQKNELIAEQGVANPARLRATVPPFELDRLCLFAFAWAMASLLHCLTFGERLNLQHPLNLALLAAAALVILVPQSVWPFVAMLCISMGNTLDWMPFEPNHILFEFIVNMGILGALGWTIARHYARGRTLQGLETPAGRAALFDAFAPFVRVCLLLLYFYAVLHKLNRDYFNTDISCSTALLQGYAQRLPFLLNSAWARWSAVWGTIAIEAAIPLLLCWRKTRSAGIVLGMGFHFFLAFHPAQGLYSFSGLLFALYLLFVPVQFPGQVQRMVRGLLGSAGRWAPAALRVAVAGGAVALVAAGRSAHLLSLAGLGLWLGWGLAFMTVFVLVSRRNAGTPERFGALVRVQPAAFWLIPALVFFNGMNPYLGLKTEKSFAMFSNLRTEGGVSNHLLISHPLYLTDLQLDLVEIKATNLETLRRVMADRQLITYFELRRAASEAQTDFFVRFVRHGAPQTVRVANGVSNQPALTRPYPWLVTKFVRFRPVDQGPCTCKH